MDSPRGRIDLMKAVADGELPLDEVSRHFDACLGCMACVTACPSGVRYDLLIESTRATVETHAPRSPFERAFRALIFALFPYPKRLRALMVPLAASGLRRLARFLPRRFRELDALLPPLDPAALRRDVPAFTPAAGTARARVGLLAGCVARVLFSHVNAATVRVLAAEGCDVVVPPAAGCCGALSLHSGRLEEAKRFARGLIASFESEPVDAIVVNAAGCGSAMKEYGQLLADDPAWRDRAAAFAAKVRDVTEYLAGLEPRAVRGRVDARIAYHDACHLAHAQRIRSEPRALLAAIPGVRLCEIPQGEQCCGSAGTYNLFEPASAREIGERKVDAIVSVDPDLVASANPGCTLQIGAIARARGVTLRAAHPVEILDASLSAGRAERSG
jgi:glycolate oxidase iron-sulfur subunit